MNRSARLAVLIALALICGDLAVAGSCDSDLVEQVRAFRIGRHVASLAFPRSSNASRAAAAAYIADQFTSYGYAVTLEPAGSSENVIARLDGVTEPNRVVVLGAHFDTVSGSPGADDNASGVGSLLEIARVLASHRPRFSIELVAFALEEQGLAGSEVYARRLAGSDQEVLGAIVYDMIGYTCSDPGCQIPFLDEPGCLDVEPEGNDVGDFILAGTNGASLDLLESWSRAAEDQAFALPVVRVTFCELCALASDFRRSDHAPFWENGMPAIVLSDGAESRNPHYHLPTDTRSTLDLGFTARVTRATLATLLNLAGCPPTSNRREIFRDSRCGSGEPGDEPCLQNLQSLDGP